MLNKLLAFLKRDFLEAISYKIAFVLSIFGIFFSLATFFFISKLIPGDQNPLLAPYGGDYFSFVIIGLVFAELLRVFENRLPVIIRQGQVTGTLESIFMTRTSIPTILVGSSVYPFLFSLFKVALYFILGLTVFGVKLGAINWPAAIAIFFLSSICFLSIGILSASFIMVYKMGDPFNWIVGSFSTLLGGVFFPVTVLPQWIRWISYLLPITHTLEGARQSVLTSSSFSQILPNILSLCVFGAVLFPLSLFVFRLALRKAKRDGILAHY